ncbi:crosslink repair DNA glycosylase YcaQ family protein [Streptomyces sp. PH10-H1]|uniref:DNA glycosylase AlkZ-like family protein n=1 Tax=Streptomyces sp. PH10-H1 TaxID=3046212 RepID=UPI0024B8ABDE|nr:crosslink repair DNA glycosylase YcaQ family protein [Streptomyces sp. PH10-H1]MDJ0345594.1 hypothetical protein [Streptomyces sp. PH10-H1]
MHRLPTQLPRVTWAEASARRLERQALAAPSKDAGPAGIAGAMCGAHAQVLSAAELSIGLRIDGGTRGDIRDALWTGRSLVKTFGPRGTVHPLPPAICRCGPVRCPRSPANGTPSPRTCG